MWNEKLDKHRPMPCKHYSDTCFWCGMLLRNPIHEVEETTNCEILKKLDTKEEAEAALKARMEV